MFHVYAVNRMSRDHTSAESSSISLIQASQVGQAGRPDGYLQGFLEAPRRLNGLMRATNQQPDFTQGACRAHSTYNF